MTKTKRLILFILFFFAALIVAVGGFLFSRLSPSQQILEAIKATAAQSAEQQAAIRRDYPAVDRFLSLGAGSGEMQASLSFSEIQNVPFAPLVGSMLQKTGGELTIQNDAATKTTSASLLLNLPGAAQMRAAVYTSPETVCFSMPEYSETVISAHPRELGALALTASSSGLPIKEVGALAALEQIATADGLREPLLKLGGSLLAKAKFSQPQPGVIRVAISGEAGRTALLSLCDLLEEQGLLFKTENPFFALTQECDAVPLTVDFTLSDQTIAMAQLSAQVDRDQTTIGAIELSYINDRAIETLTLTSTDQAGGRSRLSTSWAATDLEEHARLDYTITYDDPTGKSGSAALTLTADRADALDCSLYLSKDGKSHLFETTGGSLTAQGELLQWSAPTLRIETDALPKIGLVYRLALNRVSTTPSITAPEATALSSMSQAEKDAFVTACRDGVRQTFGNMLGGMLFG